MRIGVDGSVLLNPDEVNIVARVLQLGRQLAEQMGAEEQGADSNTVESELLGAIDLLDDMGVSSDELTERLAPRRESV